MLIEKTSQGWSVSELVNEHLVSEHYIGYSRKDAISAFNREHSPAFTYWHLVRFHPVRVDKYPDYPHRGGTAPHAWMAADHAHANRCSGPTFDSLAACSDACRTRNARARQTLYRLVWSPTGAPIGIVFARTPRAAIRKAPKPYRRYLGEIYAEEVTA